MKNQLGTPIGCAVDVSTGRKDRGDFEECTTYFSMCNACMRKCSFCGMVRGHVVVRYQGYLIYVFGFPKKNRAKIRPGKYGETASKIYQNNDCGNCRS